MSDNDMLYMDVTTTCPDCVLQGKTIEGCAFCDGRGRAYLHDMYKRENDALREKVEAWDWFEEVRIYKPWNKHPYCTACGNRSKRGKIFDCAVDEYEKIKSTAREAVHADR